MLLFVYGSLKRGYPLHWWLNVLQAEYLGEHELANYGLYRLSAPDAWFPAMRKEYGAKVKGELYEISNGVIPVLAQVEGPAYMAEHVDIVDVDGETLPVVAFIWVWGLPKGSKIIESGVWETRP